MTTIEDLFFLFRDLILSFPYSEFFWSIFFRIWTEYRVWTIVCISSYSFRMRENVDQRNSEYGHLCHTGYHDTVPHTEGHSHTQISFDWNKTMKDFWYCFVQSFTNPCRFSPKKSLSTQHFHWRDQLNQFQLSYRILKFYFINSPWSNTKSSERQLVQVSNAQSSHSLSNFIHEKNTRLFQ